MRKHLSIFALLIALFASQSVNAGTVTANDAQTTAINFFNANAKNIAGRTQLAATLKYTKTEADNTIDFYVFDISPAKGFVIVSADDQVAPIVAYSTESNFNMPVNRGNLSCWMEHAGTHIYKAIQRNVIANQAIANQWGTYLYGQRAANTKAREVGVAPLLTTRWDQEPFYNQLCPYSATDSMRTVTGCVATAMAQIMKYWNYPAQGTGQYGYSDAPPMYFYNYGNQSANFGATTYNWQAMPDTLSSNNLAVATLMYHCGVAVATNYGDDNQGGSGSYVLAADVPGWRHSAQMAYTSYFGYNTNTLQGVRESSYSSTDWVNLMESELNAGRPIQYVGTDDYAGSHTWVCDGYDVNDMLHMNWGWGGLDNGYYNVASLTADGYNFSSNEEALIGIEPRNNLNVNATVADAGICSGSNTTLTAQGNAANANYTWTPATGLSCPTCATTTASPEVTTVYTVSMDSAGLSATTQVTVTVYNKMNLESTEVTDVTCFGAANGNAKVEVSGGVGGYNYLWSNGGTGQSISDIAGSYLVSVTDGKGCILTATATINQPEAMSAAVTINNAVCSLNNAFLSVAVQGGAPAYSYNWSSGENTMSVSSLISGDYTVTALDAAGCSVSASITVAQSEAINVNIVSSNTACSLLYATAAANVTGGSQNFSFNWSNGQTTSSVASLSAGDLSVTVTDALGCSAVASQNFIQSDSMNINIAAYSTVNNKVYGKAVANVTGGNPQYSYLWNTGDITPEVTGLTAGIYTVTITDTKGCTQTATTTIANETTGLDNVTSNVGFSIYPNPVTSSATIQLNETGNAEITMQVKTLLGQTLITRNISATETQIDLSALANGTYLVELTQGQTTAVKEVVVQK